jgi:hypothetical protein
MLHLMFAFGTDIPLGTFMYMSKSSDPYKYAVTTSVVTPRFSTRIEFYKVIYLNK